MVHMYPMGTYFLSNMLFVFFVSACAETPKVSVVVDRRPTEAQVIKGLLEPAHSLTSLINGSRFVICILRCWQSFNVADRSQIYTNFY